MIRTEYAIELEIDDDKFSITLREPTAAQREELMSLSSENSAAYEQRAVLEETLEMRVGEYEIDKEMLDHLSFVEKFPVLKAMKDAFFEIGRLKKEIRELDKKLKDANDGLETLYEKRFDMLVSGSDRVRLKESIKIKGILFRTLFGHLGVLAAQAKEKK